MASTGLDVWLGALAYGATGVAVLATGAEAPQYARCVRAADGLRRHHRAGARLPGTTFHLLRAADAAALEDGAWALQPALRGAHARDVPLDRRQAHDAPAGARASARPRADAGDDHRAAGGRAVRRDRRRPRYLHAVPGLRRRVSGRRDHRSRAVGDAAAALHRDASASSAGCAPRPAPRTRSRWCRACRSEPRPSSRACSTRPRFSIASAAASRWAPTR